jgi:choline dehydrogenase-like flavoprotein
LGIHVFVHEEGGKLSPTIQGGRFVIWHSAFCVRLWQRGPYPGFLRQASLALLFPLACSNADAVCRYVSQLSQKWLSALQSIGIPKNDHPLSGKNIGASQQPSNINPSNTTRSYAAPAYLFPNAARENLVVLTNALVEKINWSKKSCDKAVASGVTFTSGGKEYTVAAKREVLVSGGTVNTPQLLELSGIGAKDILSRAGVDQVVDLPSV